MPGQGTGGRITVNPVVEKVLESGVVLVIEFELGIVDERAGGGGLELGGHRKRGVRVQSCCASWDDRRYTS